MPAASVGRDREAPACGGASASVGPAASGAGVVAGAGKIRSRFRRASAASGLERLEDLRLLSGARQALDAEAGRERARSCRPRS